MICRTLILVYFMVHVLFHALSLPYLFFFFAADYFGIEQNLISKMH
jgi:hypothetical protein